MCRHCCKAFSLPATLDPGVQFALKRLSGCCVSQVMDMIKAKKKWDALASGNGHISIDSLIRV